MYIYIDSLYFFLGMYGHMERFPRLFYLTFNHKNFKFMLHVLELRGTHASEWYGLIEIIQHLNNLSGNMAPQIGHYSKV